jgi:hypothetical protein
MGTLEAKAVRESNLYEYGGVAKPLLTMIAHLHRPVAVEQGEKPHRNEGWCDATQNYLAQMLGCSEDNVQELLRRFVRDGWLEKEEWGGAHGAHARCRYRLINLDVIKARKTPMMGKRYVRAKRESMKRKPPANCRPPFRQIAVGPPAICSWSSGNLPEDVNDFKDVSPPILTTSNSVGGLKPKNKSNPLLTAKSLPAASASEASKQRVPPACVICKKEPVLEAGDVCELCF